jgi:cytochrome P450
MSPRDALLNSTVFPEPTTFKPERWLTTDPEQRALMEKAYLPFNKGPRMCVGFNLAYADIYHNISCMVARFDFEVVDTIPGRDVEMIRDHFVAKYARGSGGTKVKVVREY